MGLFKMIFGKPSKSSAKKSSTASKEAPKSIAQIRREMAAEDARFNRIMGEVNDAVDALGNSSDHDKAIAHYRMTIEKARAADINLSTSHDFRLVNEYIKVGRFNDAWAYLNELTMKHPEDLSKIRKEQCRIRKKEKKWIDALQFLMMSHASRYGGFNREAFLKDLKPIASRIPLVDDEPEYLADMLSGLSGEPYYRDGAAASLFRGFYKDHLSGRG